MMLKRKDDILSHPSNPCVDSTGKPKRAYATYAEALESAEYGLKERGVKLDVYKCRACGKYHLTSRKCRLR